MGKSTMSMLHVQQRTVKLPEGTTASLEKMMMSAIFQDGSKIGLNKNEIGGTKYRKTSGTKKQGHQPKKGVMMAFDQGKRQ